METMIYYLSLTQLQEKKKNKKKEESFLVCQGRDITKSLVCAFLL